MPNFIKATQAYQWHLSEAKDTIPSVSSFSIKEQKEMFELEHGQQIDREKFIQYWATTLWPKSMTPQNIKQWKEL